MSRLNRMATLYPATLAAGILVLVLSLFVPGNLAAQGLSGATDPTVTQGLIEVDSLLEARFEEQNLPGLTVAIVHDQEIVFSKGYGFENIERKKPATSQSVYRVMSVTKLFTATMLMQLRDAGRVRLDDAVTRFVPEYGIGSSFPDTRVPTLRQLASHTAGLPKDNPPGGGSRFEDLVRNLGQSSLTIPPYTAFKYSNAGVALLGGALARAAGKPYTEYVEQEILAPLGMDHSGFTTTPVLSERLAIPYRTEADGTFTELPAGDFDEIMAPAGGLLASVEDMARFIRLHFNEGDAGSTLLGVTTLREMRAPVFIDPGWNSAIALGWWIQRVGGETVYWHGGQGTGYNTAVMIVPELKLGLALFINGTADATILSNAVIAHLAPIVRASIGEIDADPFADVSVEEVENYVGHFVLQDLAEIELYVDNGRLAGRTLAGPQMPPIHYVKAGPDRYLMKDGPFVGEYMTYIKDPSGKVVRIQHGPYVFEKR